MKHIYIYGASDDLHEIETDFDNGEEFVGDAEIYEFGTSNRLLVNWEYDGDWHISVTPNEMTGGLPKGWSVRKIEGTSDFIHVQVPDETDIMYRDLAESKDL